MPVEKRVYKNLQLFKENKQDGDDLFDRLNVCCAIRMPHIHSLVFVQTSTLNQHLRDIMPGLSAKVFRTYNASITLQRQLNEISGTLVHSLSPAFIRTFTRLFCSQGHRARNDSALQQGQS
jgi:DNA topoisomerase-1